MNCYKAISDDLYIFIEYVFKEYNLQGSNLLKTAKVNYKENIFYLIFNDYVIYVNSGRKPHSKLPPYEAILNWAKSKGIPTDNSTIYKIRQGIAKNGIKARPVLDKIFELVDREWDKSWYQLIVDEILEELIKWFK